MEGHHNGGRHGGPSSGLDFPEVTLARLRTLLPAERQLYSRLFAAAGGGPDTPSLPGPHVARLLETCRLPQEALRQIWVLANSRQTETLDMEGFFVACRLCAHGQQALEQGRDLQQVLTEAAIPEPPAAAPRFEGFQDSDDAPSSPSSRPRAGHSRKERYAPEVSSIPKPLGGGSGSAFDFEAMAFGAAPLGPDGLLHSSGKLQPTGPPLPSSSPNDFGGPPALAPWPMTGPGEAAHSAGGRRHEGISRRGLDMEAAARGDDHDRHADIEPGSADFLVDVLSQEQAGPHGPTAALVRELIRGRQELDAKLAHKRRLERRIDAAHGRLEDLRAGRQAMRLDARLRKAEVENCFTALDFSRQQVEEMEREITDLKDARQNYDSRAIQRAVEEVAMSSGSGRDGVMTVVKTSLAAAVEDHRESFALAERVKRSSRQKLDLQAKQQYLLDGQRQAEQERRYAQKELEIEKDRLSATQVKRLKLAEELQRMLQESSSIARESGLGPAAVGQLIRSLAPSDTDEAPAQWRQPAKPASVNAFEGTSSSRRGGVRDEEEQGSGWMAAMSRPGQRADSSSQAVVHQPTPPSVKKWTQFQRNGDDAANLATTPKDVEDWQRRRESAPAPAG
eukprot:TRINITY_DN102762_c0_g1_i1.p1 TRINITY_DN102762_c0_g1~~TRINITY_DN102762_c0_g1_i1.p1  ORF type:complete len:621 (-),score=158.26 TRINITY_DN102762_c0_g1_i1:44-1906(-)